MLAPRPTRWRLEVDKDEQEATAKHLADLLENESHRRKKLALYAASWVDGQLVAWTYDWHALTYPGRHDGLAFIHEAFKEAGAPPIVVALKVSDEQEDRDAPLQRNPPTPLKSLPKRGYGWTEIHGIKLLLPTCFTCKSPSFELRKSIDVKTGKSTSHCDACFESAEQRQWKKENQSPEARAQRKFFQENPEITFGFVSRKFDRDGNLASEEFHQADMSKDPEYIPLQGPTQHKQGAASLASAPQERPGQPATLVSHPKASGCGLAIGVAFIGLPVSWWWIIS